MAETGTYRVAFEGCGHVAYLLADEYGDGSAWCQACGEFQVYERCPECSMLDCECRVVGEGHVARLEAEANK